MPIEKELKEDIIAIAKLHRDSDLPIAKKCYDQYIYNILEKDTSYRRKRLELYEQQKIKH